MGSWPAYSWVNEVFVWDLCGMSIIIVFICVACPAYSRAFEVHVHHYPWVDVLMDLEYVLRSHTDERFLLLYGTAFSFQHVGFEIHTTHKPLASSLSRLVLCPHRHERFLLLYGEAFLCQHVRFEIHSICKPLAFKPT